MTRPDPLGGRWFTPENRPVYDGPSPERVQQLTMTCCPKAVCPQRDYNRANLLAFRRMAQAYAALILVRETARGLWTCESGDHSPDCTDPACRFGRDMVDGTNAVISRFAAVTMEFARLNAVISCDISPQWEDFEDLETAMRGLSRDESEVEGEMGAHLEYREMVKQEVVDYDDFEYAKWFRMPMEADDGPPS